MTGKDTRSGKHRAVDAIGAALSSEFGWRVEEDVGDGEYLNVWRSAESGYHELMVLAASFDDGGSGSCVISLQYGEGDGDSFDVEVLVNSGRTDLTELDGELRKAFGGGPARGDGQPGEKSKSVKKPAGTKGSAGRGASR